MITVTQDTLDRLCADLSVQYPGFAIVQKSTEDVASTRCTTVGRIIYVSSTWNTISSQAKYIKLQHEMQHLAQYERHGTWGFLWRYALAGYRWEFERDAYYAEMTAVVQLRGVAYLQSRRVHYYQQMTGQSYYWMLSAEKIDRWLVSAISGLSVQYMGTA